MPRLLCTLLLALMAVPSIAADEPSKGAAAGHRIERLDWMTGHWTGPQGTSDTEESWLAPKGGMMLGVNRTIRANGKGSFEFLRIAEVGPDLVFFASPNSAPPTPFKLIQLEEHKATFENLENDFPHRVIYRRDGELLRARIEGTINGQERSLDWTWTRKSP